MEIKNFQFGTGKAAVGGPKVVGEFVLQGVTLHVRELKDTHVAYLVRAAQKKRNETAIISAVINFMEAALIPADAEKFEEIVLGDPGLEMLEVVEVFQFVLGLVSGADEAPAKKPTRPRVAR